MSRLVIPNADFSSQAVEQLPSLVDVIPVFYKPTRTYRSLGTYNNTTYPARVLAQIDTVNPLNELVIVDVSSYRGKNINITTLYNPVDGFKFVSFASAVDFVKVQSVITTIDSEGGPTVAAELNCYTVVGESFDVCTTHTTATKRVVVPQEASYLVFPAETGTIGEEGVKIIAEV